jgi:Protein of unknown function (DUF1800)
VPASTSDISHLLSRTGVRVDPARLQELSTLELGAVVEQVCNFSANPPLAIPVRGSDQSDWDWGEGIRHDWMDRLAFLPNPLEAKLALFWHGHFAVSNRKVGAYLYTVEYYRKISAFGAGRFEDLCQAIALDEAMLLYLDNHSNTKNSPQENFARELMELFVLGVNKGYTQTDVREAARAWSGYGVRWDSKRVFYEYDADRHDAGMKTIFGITKAWTGPEVITEMCTGSRQRQTAEFLAKKLWSFFAYEQPEAALVSALADDYIAVGLNTLDFLKKMFMRREFYSDRARQGRVKSPIEWCAMVLSATKMKSADVWMVGNAAAAGHDLLNPPNVAGWKLNNVWLTESVFWILDETAREVGWQLIYSDKRSPVSRGDFLNLAKMPVPEAVDAAARAFGLQSLSSVTRQSLERWLTGVRAAKGWGEISNLLRLVALSTEARMA